ncbi:MAG: hypothetical protein A2Z91_08775 [Deltaproteobacteria bacterium GWA2_38_16]|nr:MAG: hypothetical protein A2Z91_08775 [Deltaproteobacteria bacterium GWA2_38_16]OGQ03888.1 MAG: hypothetical protein A3D19_07340 [Deltaproteobacteria bacterium RIFCSPHIGHO2_02_FULL_38_15]OGQ30134.1 MAG: hypothetical protein A3A72_07600 [Deltaproteobacteria bacterium RIFCSPLOWO2_01_FULL_38_9]HBQ20934.1 hypothetical protein [Deltaproteobacteria bacterium]
MLYNFIGSFVLFQTCKINRFGLACHVSHLAFNTRSPRSSRGQVIFKALKDLLRTPAQVDIQKRKIGLQIKNYL